MVKLEVSHCAVQTNQGVERAFFHKLGPNL